MTDRDAPDRDAPDREAAENETGPPWARIQQSSWRGWIWAVPLAALLVAGYLGFKAVFGGGPNVTVTFPTAHGISGKGATAVRYRGLQVGQVSSVELGDSLNGVVMHLAMDDGMQEALRTGTRFWIQSPSLLSGDLSSLLSGPYLVMEPGAGEPTHHFTGLTSPPPDAHVEPGRTVTLVDARAHGIGRGAQVIYHGLEAGRVLGLSLGPSAGEVRFHVLVRPPFDTLVQPQSRFWRCSGLDVSTGGGGLDVHFPPIPRLLNGCVAFDTFTDTAGSPSPGAAGASTAEPGAARSAAGTRDSAYRLYASATDARSPLAGRPVRFAADFPGSVGGLEPGAAVTLRGIRVGEVADVQLRVRPDRGVVSTPVILDLYPERFGLAPRGPGDSPRPLYDVVDQLVRHGMRAQLAQAGLVLGGEQASLVMTDERGRRLDRQQQPPGIPAIAGGGIQSALSSVSRAADAVAALPIRTIGRNLRNLTAGLDTLVRSPELNQTLEHLDRLMANADTLTADARRQLQPALSDLRQAMSDLASTADAVQGLSGGSLRDQHNLQDLIDEMTRAARSLRSLTDYLDRHPEALIQGRSGP